jgi:hypothetical protein
VVVGRFRNRRIGTRSTVRIPLRFGRETARRMRAAGACRPGGSARVVSRSAAGRRAVTRRAVRFLVSGCARRSPTFTG